MLRIQKHLHNPINYYAIHNGSSLVILVKLLEQILTQVMYLPATASDPLARDIPHARAVGDHGVPRGRQHGVHPVLRGPPHLLGEGHEYFAEKCKYV